MAFPRSLLDRIESPSPPGLRDLSGDLDETMDAIQKHLQMMLNSRHGNSSTVPDFGTSDFSDLYRGYDSVETLQRQIRESIRRYEPRLVDVEVTFVPREDDAARVHFEVIGSILSEDGETPALFRTVLNGAGEITVKRG